MIVAFCGPSGSGKSTLLKEVKKFTIFSDKKVIIKREDNFLTIHLLRQIFGNKLFSDYKRVKFFEKKASFHLKIFSLFVSFFYPLFVYVEFLLEYLYYEVLFKEKVLMRDRYIYDYLVTFKTILKIYGKPMSFFYETFPHPSLIFFVDINKKTAIKRNKNNVSGKITSKESFQIDVLESYAKIAGGGEVLLIDNNKSLEHAVQKIKSYTTIYYALSKTRSIAIVGLDGSGKSTFAKTISTYANQLNIRCATIHFYHDNLLFKFLKLLGFFREDTYVIPKTNSKRKKTSLWAFLTWIDSYTQYLFALLCYRNNLIIFDRYFYDYLVTFHYLKIKGISLFKKTIPSVDYAFLFACDPKIALKRKPENTLDFFVSGSNSYNKIANEYNMQVIDTSSNNWSRVFEKFINHIARSKKHEL